MAELHRIMMVEDQRDIQEVGKLALELVGGFSVKICSSGQEALDCFAEWKPDLILLDVMMPGIDGPTTLTKLRQTEAGAHVPVIFLTARVQAAEVAEYKALGAWDVIPKPFDPMTLPTQIRDIWQRQHA